MRSRACARPALLATLVAALVLFASLPAQAGDPVTGRIDIEARMEPADLKPGQSGTLVIEASLLPKLHIYATGENAMKYDFIAAKGVTYDKDSFEITKHHVWKDDMGDAFDVWEGTFQAKVKIKLADDAADGTKVGMTFTYYGCNDRGCYPPVKNHEAAVVLGKPAGGAKGGGVAAADAKPTIEAVPPTDGGKVSLIISEERGMVAVVFEPADGYHFYGRGSTKGMPVEVIPQDAEGVTWGKPIYKDVGDEINERYVVPVKYERKEGVTELVVVAKYAACTDTTCLPPEEATLKVTWPGAQSGTGATAKDPVPAPPTAEPVGEVLFPVVSDDDLGAAQKKGSNLLSGNLFAAFGIIFLIGMGLAFTPCVLPIIPITVSVITGGNADIPKKRLAGLLLTYVAGLALTFATMGVVAALAGGGLSTAFEIPAVQWGIAILFFVLGFMMLGIYELQPPQWLMKLQGGAQKRSGSFIGAFLFGCLGAVIASPCTGPAIAGLLIATAKSGNAVLGFFAFMMLGLGMGAVFFAAGSLNFALRPGPWMVWVRFTFGAILVGAALYYLASGGLIGEQAVYIIGFAIAVLAWVGVAWHRTHKEGEEPRLARITGAKVAVMFLVVVGLVGFLTRRPDNLLDWIKVKDTKHLVALVEEAKADGKPVVVDFWATWCHYCKEYDALIAADPKLRAMFEQVVRIKVDVTEDQRKAIRAAVGMPHGQPRMVIFDKQGRIRRNADVNDWYGYDKGPAELTKRLDLVLGSVETAAQPR